MLHVYKVKDTFYYNLFRALQTVICSLQLMMICQNKVFLTIICRCQNSKIFRYLLRLQPTRPSKSVSLKIDCAFHCTENASWLSVALVDLFPSFLPACMRLARPESPFKHMINLGHHSLDDSTASP